MTYGCFLARESSSTRDTSRLLRDSGHFPVIDVIVMAIVGVVGVVVMCIIFVYFDTFFRKVLGLLFFLFRN